MDQTLFGVEPLVVEQIVIQPHVRLPIVAMETKVASQVKACNNQPLKLNSHCCEQTLITMMWKSSMESISLFQWHPLIPNNLVPLIHTIAEHLEPRILLLEWDLAVGTSLLLPMTTCGSLLEAKYAITILIVVAVNVDSVSTLVMITSCKRLVALNLVTGQQTRFVESCPTMELPSIVTKDFLLHKTTSWTLICSLAMVQLIVVTKKMLRTTVVVVSTGIKLESVFPQTHSPNFAKILIKTGLIEHFPLSNGWNKLVPQPIPILLMIWVPHLFARTFKMELIQLTTKLLSVLTMLHIKMNKVSLLETLNDDINLFNDVI